MRADQWTPTCCRPPGKDATGQYRSAAIIDNGYETVICDDGVALRQRVRQVDRCLRGAPRCPLDPTVWIALALLPGVGPLRFARLLEEGYPPDAIPDLPASRIGLHGRRAEAYERVRRHVRREADVELRRARRNGIRVIPRDAPDYPPMLLEIHDPPFALWVRGALRPTMDRVAVVGSRTPTAYGRRIARALAARLTECGVELVSGGARGIDAVAHEAVLEKDGVTPMR